MQWYYKTSRHCKALVCNIVPVLLKLPSLTSLQQYILLWRDTVQTTSFQSTRWNLWNPCFLFSLSLTRMQVSSWSKNVYFVTDTSQSHWLSVLFNQSPCHCIYFAMGCAESISCLNNFIWIALWAFAYEIVAFAEITYFLLLSALALCKSQGNKRQ